MTISSPEREAKKVKLRLIAIQLKQEKNGRAT
jgi:hypothetical protein